MTPDDTGSHLVPPIPIAPMPTTGGGGEPPAVTLAALRRLATQIMGSIAAAGILGAASLGGVSYMALHDVQRDVADVRAHHDEDMGASKSRCDGWRDRHGRNGHSTTTEALHRIDIRLTGIELSLEQIQNERPTRRRR